jgi:hypothetical protein
VYVWPYHPKDPIAPHGSQMRRALVICALRIQSMALVWLCIIRFTGIALEPPYTYEVT